MGSERQEASSRPEVDELHKEGSDEAQTGNALKCFVVHWVEQIPTLLSVGFTRNYSYCAYKQGSSVAARRVARMPD